MYMHKNQVIYEGVSIQICYENEQDKSHMLK